MSRGAPIFHALADLSGVGPAAITMGVFDGVHVGHQALLDATRRAASERRIAPTALVFEPPPVEVVRGGTRVRRLTPPAETMRRLRSAGVEPIGIRFTPAVRDLDPAAFIAALRPAIDVHAMVLSPDSTFGRARSGTAGMLRELGAATGFDVVALEEMAMIDGAPVSSTRIRGALRDGDIALARRLLGRAPYLAGTVVHGEARGRELGFPTANLAFDYVPALPPNGIYAGHVHVPAAGVGPGHPGLASIGVRPTFEGDGSVLVEVYLLDFDGDLYDRELEVTIMARLREERRFDSIDALVEQMRRDEDEARAVLNA